MYHHKLLRQVIGGLWLMDQKTAEAYMPAVAQLITGQKVTAFHDEDEDEQEKQPYCVTVDDPETQITSEFKNHRVPEGSIAVIPVEGPLMKADYCGEPGMATMARWIKNAESNPNIIGTILLVDSPGGTVDGTEELARVISETEKPIVSFIDGMMASAAYWLGSSTDHIFSSVNTNLIGSIGTQIRLMDWTGYYEKYGIKEHTIRADKSKNKNRPVEEAKHGNYKPLKTELLNPMNEVFLNSVLKNREGKLKATEGAPLDGTVYLTDDAIDQGLIDAKGTFRDAVEKVQELSQTSTNSNLNMLGTKFKALAAIASKQAKGQAIAAEDIDAANAELVAAGITEFSLCRTSEVEQSRERVTALETERTAVAQILDPEASEDEIPEMNLTEAAQELVTALEDSEKEVARLGKVTGKVEKPKSTSKKPEIESQEEVDEAYSEADAELEKILNQINS